MVKGGYVPGRTHPTDRARGQTTAMPTAVAAARQSYADHPMVRLETAPPGPCHAVSLQETLSGTFTACATVILDTLDTIAAFVHLYFRSGRGVRDIEFRTLPYANRSKKKLAPSLAEALKRPEQNRGLAALFDLSAELEEQSTSPLRRLVQRRHAATHRFFSVHIEGTPDPSDWIERLSWP